MAKHMSFQGALIVTMFEGTRAGRKGLNPVTIALRQARIARMRAATNAASLRADLEEVHLPPIDLVDRAEAPKVDSHPNRNHRGCQK